MYMQANIKEPLVKTYPNYSAIKQMEKKSKEEKKEICKSVDNQSKDNSLILILIAIILLDCDCELPLLPIIATALI